ncbi:MAG: FecR domain-containing protein [Prolixibacteraceae bacterium]
MDNLSKYLEDISFIDWVFKPTDELDLIWKEFCASHPEEIRNVQAAKRIIAQFRTVAEPLPEDEKIRLFAKILNQIEQKPKSRYFPKRFIALSKYAAVALLFFAIGALLFYRQPANTSTFYTFSSDDKVPAEQAQLIRANGDQVILDDQRSVIKYQKSGELVINSDTLKPAKPDRAKAQALNQLIIPYGKTSEILLPDGTKVFLNAGSRLAYPDQFTGNSREVMLLGEAYFDVKHDSKRPFVVQVNDLAIKDLGTRFNVSAYSADNQIETVLVEGKVSVKQNRAGFFTQATELVPGQLASFDRQTNEIRLKQVNVADYILWTQGMMKFQTVDLNRIIKKLERYYNIRFRFEDPMLGTFKISGKLELKEDLNEVIERIARTASVKIEKQGDHEYVILK